MSDTNRNNPVEISQDEIFPVYNIIRDLIEIYTPGEELKKITHDNIHITKIQREDICLENSVIEVLQIYHNVLHLDDLQETNDKVIQQLNILDMDGLVMIEYSIQDILYKAYYPLGVLCEPIESYLHNLDVLSAIVYEVLKTLVNNENSDIHTPEYNVHRIHVLSLLYSLGLSPDYIMILASLYLYYEYCVVPDERAHLAIMMTSSISE